MTVIVDIAHEVSPAQFFKMFLGIIGTTILTFSGYLMAVGVCPECRLAHAKGFLYIISGHPFRDAVDVNGSTEEPHQYAVCCNSSCQRYGTSVSGCAWQRCRAKTLPEFHVKRHRLIKKRGCVISDTPSPFQTIGVS